MHYALLIKLFFAFFISLISVFFLIPRLIHISSKIGLLDHPNRRKEHATPKPLIGGIAILLGIVMSSIFFVPLLQLRGFYAGLLLLGIVGFLDDFKELNYKGRLLAQILAAGSMMYYSKTCLLSFGNLLSLGPINLGILVIPLTVFCVVGVINALNMLDGVDGLAGGVSLIAFLAFAFLAYINNQPELMLLCMAFSGALAAFLRYNWHPSRLFMGDAGSLSLGFTLAFLSVAITQKKGSIVPPVAALLILALPITDAVTLMIKRVLKGKSPFYADKGHLHHVLIRMGFGKTGAVKIICSLSFIFAVSAVLGSVFSIQEYYLFAFFSGFFIFYFISSFYTLRLLKIIRKFRQHGVLTSEAR